MSLLEKLKKNSTIKDTSILTDSKFFGVKDLTNCCPCSECCIERQARRRIDSWTDSICWSF